MSHTERRLNFNSNTEEHEFAMGAAILKRTANQMAEFEMRRKVTKLTERKYRKQLNMRSGGAELTFTPIKSLGSGRK